ncbi:hypothetical protein C4585_02600 [Candidatus Parcubacteria bacterium]|nr:MAG: hypothetical protein C4585_02600 [Candidatus Parcubacteria bacterium]
MASMEEGSFNNQNLRRDATDLHPHDDGTWRHPDDHPRPPEPHENQPGNANNSGETTPTDEYEYEMGDQQTVIMPDGSRRPMTPEEKREIARVEAIKLARQDLGLPDEDIPPAPGMPRFKLRQLNQQGQSDTAASPSTSAEGPTRSDSSPSGSVRDDINERLQEEEARTDQDEPYTPEQLARAQSNLRDFVRRTGITDRDQLTTLVNRISAAATPGDVRTLVHDLQNITNRPGARPADQTRPGRTRDQEEAERWAGLGNRPPGRNEPPPGGRPPTTPPGAPPERPQTPEAPQEPQQPSWVGNYFLHSRERWETFDPGKYADVVPKSIPEIRGNKKYQQLFGEMLMAIRPDKAEEIAAKIANNEPQSEEDRRFIEYAQYEFTRQVTRAEKFATTLKKEDIELLAAHRADFREMVNQYGPEAAAKAYGDEILHLAMHDKGTFEHAADVFEKLKDREATRRAENAEAGVQRICDRLNIPRRNARVLFNPNDPRRTKRNVTEHIHKQAGTFRRGLDLVERYTKIPIIGSSRSEAVWTILKMEAENPENFKLFDVRSWVTRKIRVLRTELAEVLTDTISGEEFRQKMERQAWLGEQTKSAIESGPQSYEEAQRSGTELSQQTLQRLFDRDKAGYHTPDGRGWADMDMGERTGFRDSWNPSEVRRHTETRGFGLWALLGRAIAWALSSERKNKLSLN